MIMNDIKYSDIRAQLTGTDGNAYSIIGRVGRALEDTGVRTDIERVGRGRAFDRADACPATDPVAEDQAHLIGGGDLVGDCILDRRITGERRHGRHVTIGIGHLVFRPDSDPRQWRKYADDHAKQGGDQ